MFSISLKRTRCGNLSREDSHLLWHSHKVRLLKAGTVEKLVEYLAPYRQEVDVSYRTCFLCTYRTFTTTARVLQLLIDRSAHAVLILIGQILLILIGQILLILIGQILLSTQMSVLSRFICNRTDMFVEQNVNEW